LIQLGLLALILPLSRARVPEEAELEVLASSAISR
jgi:hypothetical protein